MYNCLAFVHNAITMQAQGILTSFVVQLNQINNHCLMKFAMKRRQLISRKNSQDIHLHYFAIIYESIPRNKQNSVFYHYISETVFK